MDGLNGDLGPFATVFGWDVVLIRLAMAATLGLAIGLDREYHESPAGMRTHMLVSLAAAVFGLLAFELVARADFGDHTRADPVRVLEAVTAGVAFLAAGTIIQARGHVRGLTTGAGMWLAGAIGLACATGAYTIALMATGLGLVILRLVRLAERMLPKKEKKQKD